MRVRVRGMFIFVHDGLLAPPGTCGGTRTKTPAARGNDSAIADVDALPAKQPCVDRPRAGAEQCQGNTERGEKNMNPGISRP
jgi:hypothetical protein